MTAFPRDALVLGCAPLGGLYHRVFTVADVQQVVRAAVLKHGIRAIDTAPWYGCGKSEADLGTILAGDSDLQRAQVDIYTKVGRVLRPRAECDRNDPRAAFGDTCYAVVEANARVVPYHDYTALGIAEAIHGSLERLRFAASSSQNSQNSKRNYNHRLVELRLHDAEDDERVDEATRKGGVAELVAQCRRLGAAPSLGMNEPSFILRLLRHFPDGTFRSVLMAGNWSLMENQHGLDVMEFCEARGIAVHNAGIFGAGLLWGAKNYRYRAASEDAIKRRDAFDAICAELGVSLPAAAFAFAKLPPVVTKIVFGCTSVAELDGCVKAADESVSVPVPRFVSLAAERKLFTPRVAEACMRWAQRKRGGVGGAKL